MTFKFDMPDVIPVFPLPGALLLPRAKHEPSQEPPLIREATFDAVAAWVANPDRPDIAESSDVKLVQKRSRPGDARYGFISSAP